MFHANSFLLIKIQGKILCFSIHHVIRQGEYFVSLVVVTSTKEEKTVLGTSRILLNNEMKMRKIFKFSIGWVSFLSGIRASSWAKVDEKGRQLVQRWGFRLYGTPPLPIIQDAIVQHAPSRQCSQRKHFGSVSFYNSCATTVSCEDCCLLGCSTV
jgi:hypothetical protein